MLKAEPIIILGAGPTGLGAAYMLQRSGHENWLLLEREMEPGGLARSIRDEHGFTWDLGGHVQFSHYGLFTRLMDELLGPDEWIHHERESWIRLLGTWVPYPFQNNIHRLPPEACAACLEGLIRSRLAQSNGSFASFDDFIARTFGEGIANLFMRPYNRKVWAYDPAKLGAGWIGERVAVPDPIRVARNVALKSDDVSWGPNNKFRFPRHGGTGAVWRELTKRLPSDRISTGKEVKKIDAEKKIVVLADGREIHYSTLISTLPLDRLAAATGKEEWIALASRLIHSSVHVIGVGLNGRAQEHLKTKCWMYFPEANCPFYRVTHFSLYSPNNVDDITKHWSLMAEVSESPDKPVDAKSVVDETVRGMVAAGLIESANQVRHTWHRRLEYGYPTPSRERDEILKQLQPRLQAMDIYSRGRFGAWMYEASNQDHSFMQGVEAAGHILHGSAELTIWNPDMVNTPDPVLGWDRFR